MEDHKAEKPLWISIHKVPRNSQFRKRTESKPGIEYFINFSVTTVEPEPLIPAGHEIAYEQFRLPPIEPLARPAFATNGPALKVQTEGKNLTATSSKVVLYSTRRQDLSPRIK